MKSTVFLSLFIFISHFTFGQAEFSSGYYIDRDNNKVKCLLLLQDWDNSPGTVIYKLDEKGSEMELNPQNCKEFGIEGEVVYRSIREKIPRTDAKVVDKTQSKEPRFVLKNQFAQVLMEGTVSLYETLNNGEAAFLVLNDEGNLTVLAYKEYIEDGYVRRNNIFKRQILKEYSCLKGNEIQSLEYTRKSMLSFFKTLNNCLGNSEVTIYQSKINQKLFTSLKTKLWIGVNQTGYEARNITSGQVVKFDNGISFRAGLEIESFFRSSSPKKFSTFLALVYSQIENSIELPFDQVSNDVFTLKVNALESSLGARYYLSLSSESDVFLDVAVLANFYLEASLNESVMFGGVLEDRPDEVNEIAPISRSNDIVPSFGIGYSYNKKVYLRFNYLLNQNLVDGDVQGALFQRDSLSQISLSLGYTL
ncbi:hypothetical protein [Flagellimonas meridianipacifica]|uniref:Outer membrane protein with beta-barrel domain n=1 Tax=Flagellimonas meridianipacifica TaxID=1080225 RepID=A0A2T0MA46_9FLAO|nr:hypothetical protein [Allomuricauda pacifica]PRX54348.1 hypothetical protein CLV81_2748 [Allomuricauda pacifica]